MAHQELITSWLKDAYSMEVGLVPILENHAKDAKDYPEVQSRIQQHVEETKQHAEMVKQCLERKGEKPSTVKTAVGGVMGSMQSVATGPFKDELVKNSLADYATEHFEMASYDALIDAAKELGDNETAQTCQKILHSEQAMAQWLKDHLPMAVRDTIQEKMTQH